MLLLGAVLEVNKVHVVFSLPFNLRGIVAITDVSDLVTDLVRKKAGGIASSDVVKQNKTKQSWLVILIPYCGELKWVGVCLVLF